MKEYANSLQHLHIDANDHGVAVGTKQATFTSNTMNKWGYYASSLSNTAFPTPCLTYNRESTFSGLTCVDHHTSLKECKGIPQVHVTCILIKNLKLFKFDSICNFKFSEHMWGK